MYIHICIDIYTCIHIGKERAIGMLRTDVMENVKKKIRGYLRLVGSLKLQVSFAPMKGTIFCKRDL